MINMPSTKKHILLVDDDQAVTQMLSLLLSTRGYEISICTSGEEALKKQEVLKADLILLDMVLPDMEGFDVCRRFKENRSTSQTPIIVLSGKVSSQNKIEVLHIGADDYLTKPFDYEELVARIEAVLRRSSNIYQQNTAVNAEEGLVQELRRIIKEEQIVPFYQPIFNLKKSSLLGLEVLCRPRTQTILSNPELLFKAAIEFGVYQDLEILSWRKALEYASQNSLRETLFLNCNPYLVEGSKFLTLKSLFELNGFKVENVVLEITERSAISDYKKFYERLTKFRDHGFRFAVDDVGGGYASLESIVETKPEVVKIDRHIVDKISQDNFKRSVVKFIVSFCQENNIVCIAEGIETKEDLDVVIELGVDAVQGYYLQKPSPHVDLGEIRETLKAIA